MTTVKERLARAMGGVLWYGIPFADVLAHHIAMGGRQLEEARVDVDILLTAQATAVLHSLLEPSPAMIEAMMDRDKFGYDPLPEDVFRAAIQAALDEFESG